MKFLNKLEKNLESLPIIKVALISVSCIICLSLYLFFNRHEVRTIKVERVEVWLQRNSFTGHICTIPAGSVVTLGWVQKQVPDWCRGTISGFASE